MNALRNTATPPEVTPTLLCGTTITQHRKILTTGIAPSKLLKTKGRKGSLPISY